ncbi:DedA family protein [Streptomyces sp. NPDC093109]|uniref:DedA family protein n=1 Tax=Streptomyces sp. NPDC093109 TaxID=3154977 RepID=UPI0034501484
MATWPAGQVLAHGSLGILAAVLLLPALEAALPAIGALMPGQTAAVMGGTLAWHGHVAVEATLLTAFTGAVLGNLAGYAVGRRWQGRLTDRLGARSRPSRYAGLALGLVERRGASAVFVGRFTVVLRTLVPALCGAAGIPLRSYLLWSVLSSTIWASAFVLIGYVIGSAGPG